jgi:hypothetical protein
VTLQEPQKQADGGREARGARRTGVLIALAGLVATSGCAYTATAQQPPGQVAQTTTTAGSDQENLFAAPLPRMIPGGPTTPDTEGENVVPTFCRPVSAGLSRSGSGFLLVVRMGAPIPSLNSPPALPYGVILSMIEINVGIFAPNVNPELGGGYKYVRQYQTPDRPALEIIPLGSGKTDTATSVNVAVREQEIRIQLPDAGQDTGRVNQWGLSVTCLLRHPVDGFYFPSTRFPAGRFERAPL